MEIGKNGKVQDPGSREGVAKFEGFPLEIKLVLALTCVRVRNNERKKEG